jgi:hypothetical protein
VKSKKKQRVKKKVEPIPNPNHKEDFDKVLEMLVPKVKPKGIKSDKLLEED